MKKLVFVDSDGTLKNSKGIITEKTIQTLEKLKNSDIEVIITTGRPRYHALKVKNISHASRYVISSNGAEIYDSENDSLVYASYLTKTQVMNVFEIANNNNARCIFTIDGKEVVMDVAKNENQIMLDEELEQYLDKHKVKQVFIRIDGELEARKTYKEIKDLKNVSIANESSYFQTGIVEEKGIWFSVTNKEVNKGKAIKELCKYLGVSLSETYGFGNDYNDIAMFKMVKHSIVMDNANADLKKRAKIIAKSNDEEGVAMLLEELFLTK